jgi:hypothetical protein
MNPGARHLPSTTNGTSSNTIMILRMGDRKEVYKMLRRLD